eukprot:4111291-Pleurochrysis_carterae.AAC.2
MKQRRMANEPRKIRVKDDCLRPAASYQITSLCKLYANVWTPLMVHEPVLPFSLVSCVDVRHNSEE